MRLLLTLVLASSLAPLCGCGINSSPLTDTSSQGSGGAHQTVSGRVHGGQFPISGGLIQLWAVGTTGYGSAATSLLFTNRTTDANGFFDITADYSCAGNPLVYLTATGGNPGGPGNNSNILLVAPLGYCNSLAGISQIWVDEVTTVAAAYALGQFTNPATGSIGSWGYSNTGLVNAFSTVNNLVDITQGTALTSTPSGIGIVPQSEIDTLGNIMASCVNSTSSNASLSTGCAAFFSAATPPGGTAPTDTFDAMVDIARNPGQQVSTIFGLAVTDPPFNPILGTAPQDWAMPVAWNARLGGEVAVDSAGNVWHRGSGIEVLSPTGVLTNNPAFVEFGLALDTNDHAWLYNSDGNLVAFQLTTIGGVSSISSYAGPFTLPSENDPLSNIAIDANNNIWLPLDGGLTKVNTSGAVLGTYPLAGGSNDSRYVGVDSNGNVWVTYSYSSAILSEYSNSGTLLSPSGGFTGGGLQQAPLAPPALDAANNVWVGNTNSLSEFSSTGSPISPGSGYVGGGQDADTALLIDGNGTAWVGSNNGISSVNSSGVATSPSTGYGGFPLIGDVNALAIDASGDLWFSGTLARGVNPIGLIEYVGIAAPVVTPLASAIATHQLGTRPGTPIPVVLTSTEIPPTFGPNFPYSAQLYVTGGNTGTYLWSIASGALPSGFTLNSSTGLISGSSIGPGTASFTVKVCDAQNASNCASRAFTLTYPYSAGLPALGGESLLNGNYVIHITGMQNAGSSSAPGSAHGTALVGVLRLGGGILYGGDFYSTGPQEIFESTSPSGYYDLPANGAGPGRLVFYDEEGNWYQFSVVADKIVGGVAQEIHLTEFDDTQAGTGQSGGSLGGGIGKLQTGTYFMSYLQQSFAFGLEGETPCTDSNNTNPACGQTVAPFGSLSAAGVLTGTSATALSGKLDAAGVGTSYNSVGITGTWLPPSYGNLGFRGSLTLTYTGTLFPVPPTHFAYYPVSNSEFFFISTDSHANTSLLSGDAIAQSGTLNTGTLNGDYLGVESGASGGDGVSVYGSTVNSTVRFIDSNGASAAIIADENAAGTLTQLTFQGGSAYNVDSSGRTTFTLVPNLPIFYLANGTQGFGVEQPTAGNPPGLITLTQQANMSFGASSLSGPYAFDDLNVPAQSTTLDGILTADGVSAGTITADQVSRGGLLSSPTESLSYTMTSGGRGTLTLADGTGYILWLLSPTQWIALPTGTDPKPLILTGTHQ